MKILFIGDIIGNPGRKALKERFSAILGRHDPDVIIANGENAAGGFGITEDIAAELFKTGVNVITSGNHIWDKKEAIEFIERTPMLLRPANYPDANPGKGYIVLDSRCGAKLGVLNLSGRVFMDEADCPFRTADRFVEEIKKETNIILVDFHAEATSEKYALAWYLDGRVSALVGTHTHVQTSDERILPGGTAYITDAGMTGPTDSVIGVEKELVLKRFLTRMPVRFEVASRGVEVQGVSITIDASNGRATSIERIKEKIDR